jgi:arylsulfatase A-like enzyme
MGDGLVAEWASQRLRQPQTAPQFLAVGFYRPHIPLFAPRKYFQPYRIESIVLPESPANDLDDLSELGRRTALEPVTAGLHATVVKHQQWPQAVAGYLACVSFIDAQIGKLLDALDAGPQADNTLVVLWSDHGWHLGEKQHWGKWTGWERATRVPLVIVPPRASAKEFAAGLCPEPAGLIDIYPTLVEMCRLPQMPRLDGASLVPQLQNPQASSERQIITTFDTDNYSVRDRRWRWIRYRDGAEELYDHQTDPRELNNVARDPALAGVKQRLAQALPRNPLRPKPMPR